MLHKNNWFSKNRKQSTEELAEIWWHVNGCRGSVLGFFLILSLLSSFHRIQTQQKETDNNKKLFPHLRIEMTETRGNSPRWFPPHFSLSSFLLFELPPALMLSAPTEISTAPIGHLCESSQDELPSLWWGRAVQGHAPVPAPRSHKV